MLRKNWFYISLIIIYLLFLMKDNIFKLFDNRESINNFYINNNFYEEEYKSLASVLDIEIIDKKMVYSRIITRDIYEFFDKITISKGSLDNIKKGDIVINEYGLVGIIDKVNKNFSEVALITNNNTNISVKINNSYGILYAKDNKLYVKNVKLDKEIKEGDIVYTSGLTNTPENIKVGVVSKINTNSLELEYILDINSFNNFNNIKYVGVITS